jgi:hypothetical protein
MRQAAENLAITVGDHDDAEHDPQYKQSKGLNAIESSQEASPELMKLKRNRLSHECRSRART